MKKGLLITLMIIFVLIMSTLIQSVMAVTVDIVENQITGIINRTEVINEDGSKTYSYYLSVVLPSSTAERDIYENFLTKEDVIRILEGKYKKGIVDTIVDNKGKEVSDNKEKVGTGAIVTLTTGRKITIILYIISNSVFLYVFDGISNFIFLSFL